MHVDARAWPGLTHFAKLVFCVVQKERFIGLSTAVDYVVFSCEMPRSVEQGDVCTKIGVFVGAAQGYFRASVNESVWCAVGYSYPRGLTFLCKSPSESPKCQESRAISRESS